MRIPTLGSPGASLPGGLGRMRGAAAGFGWRRGLTALVVLGVASVGGVKGYERLHPAPKAAVAVQTVPAAQRSIVEAVTLPGTVGAGRLATLSFSAASNGTSISGIVKSVSVKTGDAVKIGQEIARLDTTALDLAVQS